MKNKFCLQCKIEKRISAFSKDRSQLDGLSFYCAECKRLIWRAWFVANEKKVKERNRKFYLENRERILKKGRANYDPEKRRIKYLVSKKMKKYE